MKVMKTKILNWLWRRKILILIFLLVLGGYSFLLRGKLFNDPASTVIFDRNGLLLGAKVATDDQWRFPASRIVSEKIKKATIAFEDRYFYYHPGFNPVSLIRAVILNVKSGKIVRGGSTITMQTIRLARKGKSRTIIEKMVEIVLATRLELKKTKEEILALYVSYAPYGGNVVGIEAASWRYFGTRSDHLSWAEAATLAVLPNAPALVHPGKNRRILLTKRNDLLNRLYKLGWIDLITLQTSLTEPIPEHPLPLPRSAPHLLDRFYREKPGEITTTTIDERLQKYLTELIEKYHKKLQYNEIHNLAALIVEVETGNVLAYVGNTTSLDHSLHDNEVDVIQSSRSTGSLLKPVLYAAMLDDGRLLPASLIPDVPMNLSGFAPQNFNGQFEGAIPANRALSRSLNVPIVLMLKDYGIERFHHLLKALGMTTVNKPSEHYGLTLILGGAEGNLAEMTNIYACFSRIINHYSESGLYYTSDYRSLNYILNNQHVREKGTKEPGMLNASSLWFTYKAMNEVNRPEEERNWKNYSSARKIAWKTGTSFGYRDGWAIGTSPEYVVGVWAGNADGEGRPGLTGIATAAPVLFDIFGALTGSDWFSEPVDELIPARVCKKSGYLAGQYCDDTETINIQFNGTKSPPCPFHQLVHLTADRALRVNSNCIDVDSMIHVSWFVLPTIEEWYYNQRHNDYLSLPPYKAGCEPESLKSMDLLYPGKETRIFIPVELNGKKSRVIFEALHKNPDATIYWHMDKQFVAATHHIHQIEILPGKGKHTLILLDNKGEELVRHFEMIDKETYEER
jgi:penicillin-binding protein 1C